MNHRPHTSLELTPTRTTTLTTPTTTTTRKQIITTPSSSFHEEYDEFGDVIKVGNITLTDTVLGTGAYATVRLAKRRTLHHHPNGGGSFNLNLHIHNTKSSDSNTLPVLSSLSSSIHYDTHNDDNEEKVEVEEELVAVKVYSKSFLKRQRNFQRCRSTSNTSPRRIKYHTALDQVEKEIALMKMMRHPNLVSLLQVIDSVERDALYVVLEYVPRGEIMTFDAAALRFRHLHSSNSSSSVVVGVTAQKYFEEAFAALYFVDVLHGLAYLHRHHICHRDLKPENILLDELGVAKITDFGVSHYFDEEEQLSVEHNNHHDRNKNGTMMDSSWGQQQEAAVGEDTSPNAVIDTTQHAKRRRLTRYDTDSALAMHRMSDSGTLTETNGTFCFYAPEMCCSSSSDKSESGESEQLSFSGYASDLWSAGICLYIFASGKLPFYSDDPSELFSKIANTDVPLHGEDCHHFSDELKDLLSMILQRDPEKRAGIGDCLKHPFCEKARKERVKFLGEEINESLLKKIIVQREHIKNVSTTGLSYCVHFIFMSLLLLTLYCAPSTYLIGFWSCKTCICSQSCEAIVSTFVVLFHVIFFVSFYDTYTHHHSKTNTKSTNNYHSAIYSFHRFIGVQFAPCV